MKIKTITIEGKNYAEVNSDGLPIYVHDDGKEVAFDAAESVNKIRSLNAEAKSHREAKEAAESRLRVYDGIEDPEAAKRALETLKNIDEGKLLTAGKVEEIKFAAKKAAEENVAAAKKAADEALATVTKERDSIIAAFHGEKIGSAFANSETLKKRTLLPGPAALKIFGEHFKVEGDKITAYDTQGSKIFSRERPGEEAGFEEALDTIISSYPHRDSILRGSGGGSGHRGSGGAGGGEKQISRAEFDRLDAGSKQKTLADGIAVVDV